MVKKKLNFLKNPFLIKSSNDFSNIEYKENCQDIVNIKNHKKTYQVVIMAAGKGTRMKSSRPKALYEFNYPTGTRSILENTIQIIKGSKKRISAIFLVIRKSETQFFKNLDDFENMQLIVLDDSEINGTAICLNNIKEYLFDNLDILLFWGDLALMPQSNIYLSIQIHEFYESDLTFPSRYKYKPYVAFIRDKNGKVSKIVHSNEINKYDGWAEQDCLFFIIKFDLMKLIPKFIKDHQNNIKNTNTEIDFIHFILYATKKDKIVLPLPISNDSEVAGVNDQESARKIQDRLNLMSKEEYSDIFLNFLWS